MERRKNTEEIILKLIDKITSLSEKNAQAYEKGKESGKANLRDKVLNHARTERNKAEENFNDEDGAFHQGYYEAMDEVMEYLINLI